MLPHGKPNAMAVAVLAISAISLRPASAIEIAGTLFVNLDASTLSVGDTTWTNDGTYTDFEADGSPFVTLDPVPAVYFDGTDAFVGDEPAPEGLVGFDPTRTIEVWAWNPTIAGEETMVSWGKRGGPEGTNMAFNYGDNGQWGAVGHWGGGTHDVGWMDNDFTPGAPDAQQWHHLVYTYDEEFARVYSDGELMNEEDMIQWGGLDTHPDSAIAIASQWEADGVTLNPGLKGTLFISKVRIHDEVLTDSQISANYEEERGAFVETPVIPLPPPPPDLAGLWRFDDEANLGLDSSLAGNDLVPTEGVTFEADGKINGAAFFDGIDGMLTSDDINDDLPTQDGSYTVAAWIQPEDVGARGIVGWGAYGSGRSVNALRIMGDNGFRHYWWGADLDAQDADVENAGVDLDDGEWHHITAVYDGDTRSLFLNGELLVSDSPGDNNAQAQRFAVGRTCDTCGGGEFFLGPLDDVAVFNIALDADQIQAIMSGDFSSFLTPPTLGDYNFNGMLDAGDLDLQAIAISDGNHPPEFDLNGDDVVNIDDRLVWVNDLKNSWIGDANLDLEFNSGDMVQVFSRGKYETGETAGWEDGDWNGDRLFSSGDMVAAFVAGGYEQGVRTNMAAVPEPTSSILLFGGLIALATCRRRFSA